MLLKTLLSVVLFSTLLSAQQMKIAVVGLVHSHVWGHLGKMVSGDPAQLVGVAETREDLIAEAKKRGVKDDLIFSDYQKMLDQTKPDIIWAFVENNRHLEIIKAAAPRHIHVIFEKPLSSSLKDAIEIKKIADAAGIKVMCNYQMAWWPANYVAKAKVDSGAVGEITRIRGIVGHGGPGGPTGLNKYFFNWLTDPVQNGGGALVDFGCYNALWSIWYLGMPTSVYATAQHVRPQEFPKVEDGATLVLNYPHAVGVYEASWNLPRSFQDVEIFGRKGSVYMQRTGVEYRAGREKPEAITIEPLPADRAEPITFMVEAIKNKKPIEGMTAMDLNIKVLQVLEAAKESIKTGKAVAIK